MNLASGQTRISRFFELFPLAAGVLVIVIAIAQLIEWNMSIDPVTGFFPGGIAMGPMPCVLFLLGGTALVCESTPERARALQVIALTLAGLIIAVAAIEGASWLAHRNLGLDLVLFPEALKRAPWTPPGRLAVNTVLAMTFIGLGLIAIQSDDRTGRSSAHWLGTVSAVISFLALVGYAFGVTRFYAFGSYSGMAVVTAACTLIMSGGIILARRRSGLPRLLADPGAAGSVARRLVPAAILVPFLLGWLRLLGEHSGWYDTAFGVSSYVVGTVAIFLWLVGWTAGVANESDRVREELYVGEQKAREVAEGANLSKSNFLAVMSHELRTPLSAIIGYEELLADGITGPVNDAQKHQLSRMKASAQHLLHLIDQILAYSRIDAGREVVQYEDVDANELALDASSLVEPLAREKGLPLEVIPTGYMLPISTDGGKVRQILVNLLSNSVKFTPAGRITVIVQHDGGVVRYVVRDTGIGIAPEHRDRIFEAFWQVEQPSTRRVGGTGLGLSVTRRLARLLGGDVTVESSPGGGSAFTVTLPVEPHESAPAGTRTESFPIF